MNLPRLGRFKFFLAVSCALLLWGSSGRAQEANLTPRIQGTFLQLTTAQGDWSPEKWSQLFGYFRQLKLSRLIIQWSVYDDLAFFPGQDFRQVSRPPLETILALADASGMEVLLGLVYDPQFWEKINREPQLVEVYLRRLRLRSQEAAQALLPLAQSHPSWRGWYLPEEIDDVNWQKDQARRLLIEHLSNLGQFLRQLTPGAKLAISGFANGRTDPQTLGNFWQEVLTTAPMDLLLFQDGVGTGKLSPEDLPPYLKAIRQAAAASGREFQVVIELFRQVSAQPFKAQPAPCPRVQRQLKIASAYTGGGVVAFSVPEYLTPLGGPAAARLFEEYLARVKGEPKPNKPGMRGRE